MGTRGSLLARMQSRLVAEELERKHAGLHVEVVPVTTSGDRIADRPLHEFGGKGLFTKELERALLDGQIDFAVHSFKDVPTTMPLVEQTDLAIVAVPARQDPRDVLVGPRPMSLAELPANARVGTGSLRRRCQLLALRPDLRIEPVRGNIDTRIGKQKSGEFDAVILAMAGLVRAQLFEARTMRPIDAADLIPAPGQGALALQCRRNDAVTSSMLEVLHDPASAQCVATERALVELLNGDCLSPIGALAQLEGDVLTLTAAVGGRGGIPPVVRARVQAADPQAVAMAAFADLARQGAEALLAGKS